MRKHYDNRFYERQVQNSFRSASKVLDLLFPVMEVDSMIDFGCGRGAWLKAAEERGVTRLVGIDGPWSDEEKFLPKTAKLIRQDLETPLTLDTRFSLAMSVEVAEHLSPPAASSLIKNLCTSSDAVLFGAATKFQGGTNHINERRASEWAALFRKEGYQCLDVVRKCIWDQKSIGVAYRQNLFLFVKKDKTHLIESILEKLPEADMPIDVIHPDLYEYYMEKVFFPDLRFVLGRMYRFFKYSILRFSKNPIDRTQD